jgi:hypothetical protein
VHELLREADEALAAQVERNLRPPAMPGGAKRVRDRSGAEKKPRLSPAKPGELRRNQGHHW